MCCLCFSFIPADHFEVLASEDDLLDREAVTEAVVFGRRQRIRTGTVARHAGQRGQVTQGTRDVRIPVWVRNKPTVLHPLVTRGVGLRPPLTNDLPVTNTCWQDLVAVEKVIRVHRVPVIPVLVVNTKPQLEKLVSEDLMTAGAVLCEKLDWDLYELTRDPASSWNVTLSHVSWMRVSASPDCRV